MKYAHKVLFIKAFKAKVQLFSVTLDSTHFPKNSPLACPFSLNALQLTNFHFREIRALSAIISIRIAPRARRHRTATAVAPNPHFISNFKVK